MSAEIALQDRRRIEQEMFRGHLLGIIATTALELGIDIGSLDAVITVGFPYTLPGLRQQAGRAGRRNKDSLAMLICDPFPIEFVCLDLMRALLIASLAANTTPNTRMRYSRILMLSLMSISRIRSYSRHTCSVLQTKSQFIRTCFTRIAQCA